MRRKRVLPLAVALGLASRSWLAPKEPERPLGRRAAWAAWAGLSAVEPAAASGDIEEPLTYCGGGFCAQFRLGGLQFRGVVDTGSPFLLVSTCEDGASGGRQSCASYCKAWGCSTQKRGQPSGLEDTDEVFAAGTARVSWKRDSLELGGRNFGPVTYGAMLEVESYGGNGGGAFLGLVREKAARIRPTLVGQTPLRTVAVDLRTPGQERLQLSGEPPGTASASAAVPMVDLRRNGAPLRYYAVQAKGLRVAGEPLDVGPLVAVLDTGTTGLGMPSGLFARYDKLRRQKASELGLRRAQAVDILLQKEDGSELSLSLLPGRQAGYGQDRFDIVTPLPEPSGMTADASALWTGEGHIGAKPMQLSNRGLVAEAPGNGVGWAQADRPLSQGDRFLVRLLPSKGRGQSAACSGWLGLAPRGACLQGEEDTSAYGGWASEGKLRAGDLIECRLADDGSGTVFWRVNGGQAITSKEPLATARMVYPTVELAEGCDVELLSTPIPSPLEREQSMSWAAPPSEEAKDRPTLVFLGLGFLLGRKMSIDTVANRVIFT